MKLSKKEINEIAKSHNLGNVSDVKVISGGWVNYNFNFKTDKGDFIVRIIGRDVTSKRKKQLQLEFKVLEYLDKKKFPYGIPLPIKNKEENYITKIKNKYIWVYKKINGRIIKDLNETQLKSIIKALALYHKLIKNFPISPKKEENELIGLKKKFLEMKKTKPRNKSDVLMLKNIDMMIKILEKIKDKKFKKNLLPVHLDFHKENVLYQENKLAGIIDFEHIRVAPRIRDIAYLIKSSIEYKKNKFIKKVEFIIKEYDQINPLTNDEKNDILLILARDSCVMFDRFWRWNSSIVSGGDYICLDWTINTVKQIIKVLDWDID
jgi:homoserine kinase type II